MAFSSFAEGEPEPWATPIATLAPEPTVESALEKEKVIKDILSLRDGLRGLMVRLSEVEEENDKLAKENETLSLYVENLTRNSVVAAGNK
ncbi:hypothetical protein C351_02266 [Cryptococcus neoformans c8]|nr:hypothetical protein C353_05442 [Cryptococcus neoformans var. grubii AD1-83a]OXG51669.1 hypothetical protein C354_05384 [Cryptococcus neoformans var. grubii MW-RSA1955]OXG55577.1 hypothetical protein C352_05366 [Cryptococcus neoformans var. grubii CHC193]OXG65828.1 hypothetical protein C351_02266 [Cryptococcus neoformans var. grubii c8]OXH04626.1 hypothetical protein C369_05572 [Cryptococcus neoformans var. grubii A5-35-17]OXH05980.1 hypothetical protein C370_05658 [Cryptococcus neoformans 